MSILQGLPFSLCKAGPEHVDGVGNFVLEVLAPAPSTDILSTLYFLDSHGQIPGFFRNPDYDPIKPSQIKWFLSTAQAYRTIQEKDPTVNLSHLSLVFLHIPLPEFKADHQLVIGSGHRGEPTECASVNSHFYDALATAKIHALGCGHDHVNDFCALRLPERQSNDEARRQHGPWLCYSGGTGFGGYCSYGKKRYHRQMRVWELDTYTEGLRSWTRREYCNDRVNELRLWKSGKVPSLFSQKCKDRSCVVS